METWRKVLVWCTRGSGEHVARALHLAIAAVGVLAFAGWYVQLDVLLGPEGLAPAEVWVERAREAGISFFELPSVLLWSGASPRALHAVCGAGLGCCILALAGVLPRLALAASALLYLSLLSVSSPFSGFQWDSLMVESFVLAALLPRAGGRLSHLAVRLLFVRLYFGSGMAKLASPLGDWLDGSAMAFYYETTPLPTPVSWWMHQLPAWLHRLESWATLALEIVLPFGAFGGRRVRHVTAAAFTAFQGLNLLTGNFGFFVYASLALHVSLVDDAVLARPLAYLPGLRLSLFGERSLPALRNAAVATYLVLSLFEQSLALGFAPTSSALMELRLAYARLRIVNSYALFATITRTRYEPIVEVDAGDGFRPVPLRYKPGPADRPLGWVAPFQPRVDFQLWFYGLRSELPPPPYVRRLLQQVCIDPRAVQPLFARGLPARPKAARIRFESYRFTDRATLARTGAYWRVERSWLGPGLRCRGSETQTRGFNGR